MPIEVASELWNPRAVKVGGGYVLWSADSLMGLGYRVMRRKSDLSGPVEMWIEEDGWGEYAFDGETWFWAEAGSIYAQGLADAERISVAADGKIECCPTLGVGQVDVFWTTARTSGELRRAPKTGVGSASVVGVGDRCHPVVGDRYVYWCSSAQIVRAGLRPATQPSVVADGVAPLAVHEGALFYSVRLHGEGAYGLMRLHEDGSQSELIASVAYLSAPAFAIDDSGGYACSVDSVVHVDIGERAVSELATGQIGCNSVAVDGPFVYWSTALGVWRVVKP